MGFKLMCPMSGCTTELEAEKKGHLLKQGMGHPKTHGVSAPDFMLKLQGATKQT